MTRIRPCIDLHEGKVKQIVGSTLKTDNKNTTTTSATTTMTTTTEDDGKANVNFSSDKPSSYYSAMYKQDNLTGGHVIMLGQSDANKKAALDAMEAWQNGWQIGGGITADNCQGWIDVGASHIIVTSYVFSDGHINYERLNKLVDLIGKDKLVLDLSCRKKQSDSKNDDDDNQHYYVVTNKWQTYTDTAVTPETLHKLSEYCCEFLVHAVDVEGKQCGIQQDLVEFLGKHSPIPTTYAGGVRSIDDLNMVHKLSNGKVDVTVGSALDIFGGTLSYKKVVQWHNEHNKITDIF